MAGGRASTAIERLLDLSIPEPNSGCWIWMGQLNEKGYGRIRHLGRTRFAHRVSFELFTGRTAEDHLDHLCRVRCCINPEHLEPVTPRENAIRGSLARGRPTHCKRGHLITQRRSETSARPGEAVCNACSRLRYLTRKEAQQ